MEQVTGQPTTPRSPGSILRSLSETSSGFPKLVVVVMAIVAIVAGAGTGYTLSRKLAISGSKSSTNPTKIEAAPGAVVTGNKVGIQDTKTFRDCAQGQLEKGGIQGEGTHHLVREGGPSQTAYLTSSVINLDQFVGKNVQVCGETISAQHAGWLMDVGIVNTL